MPAEFSTAAPVVVADMRERLCMPDGVDSQVTDEVILTYVIKHHVVHGEGDVRNAYIVLHQRAYKAYHDELRDLIALVHLDAHPELTPLQRLWVHLARQKKDWPRDDGLVYFEATDSWVKALELNE